MSHRTENTVGQLQGMTPAGTSASRKPTAAPKPLVVQSDGTLLLEVTADGADSARDALCTFAHLVSSPEYIHTYRITPLSLWNAAAAGVSIDWIETTLRSFSRYALPATMVTNLRDLASRYGKTKLHPASEQPDMLELRVADEFLFAQLKNTKELKQYWLECRTDSFLVHASERGALKQALVSAGYPCEDHCGFSDGRHISIDLVSETVRGKSFALHPYQSEAIRAFLANGSHNGGAGVIVLPCGAGKTVIGMGTIARLQTSTLVITTNTVAVRQWRDELLDKTNIDPAQIGEYTGEKKEIRPITITTYQMLTHRPEKSGVYPHLHLLKEAQWGLIVYDEVHTLPAPIFRATAEIQVRRRLGLTATLVREDGREGDVFALIGPKRYEIPWKILEGQGYIAEASCFEIRVEMTDTLRMKYALADKREQFRLASENPCKRAIVDEFIRNNPEDSILVIGQYVEQLESLAAELRLPIITGKTPNSVRERLYEEFRKGKQRVLIVSKVANFAIDLPDASLALQISGTFGSRQEEAQRLGRLLRPKERPSRFYSIVSKDTVEQEFAINRQLFLVEQGYTYNIIDLTDN